MTHLWKYFINCKDLWPLNPPLTPALLKHWSHPVLLDSKNLSHKMKLIILTSRALPLQTSLHLPFKITSTCLQFNPVPLTRFYLLSVFQMCLTHFLLFLVVLPLLKCVLQDQTPFQKAFYLNFPAYLTSLCTPFTLNICWPVTALVWWDDFVIYASWVYISSHPVTLSYPPLQRLCLCLCLSLCLLAKCDAYSGHSLHQCFPPR